MGVLTKKEDPLVKVVNTLAETLERQRQDHKDQIDKLIGQIGDQNDLLKQLLDQYINRGTNTNESLKDRMERQDQYVKEPEWGPLTMNPFDGEF